MGCKIWCMSFITPETVGAQILRGVFERDYGLLGDPDLATTPREMVKQRLEEAGRRCEVSIVVSGGVTPPGEHREERVKAGVRTH